MKFIDEATIEIQAGHGGDGCVSFRREKYVPLGGPDGGNGGKGGDIIFITDQGLTTLMDIKYHRHFRAQRGIHGKGKRMYGAAGEDKVIRVPVGTIVKDATTDDILFDLNSYPMSWVAAAGGRGGLGNACFTSSRNQAPRKATKGGEGEYRRVSLELKLLADVGVIGFPNAGKSTLVSSVSKAKPKIADYPFTTKSPTLGVVSIKTGVNFVIVDIPGLIEDAHKGAGLGIQFLRHIERTKVFLHLIDLIDHAHPDAVSNYKAIRHELGSYNKELLKRPEIVVITKVDVPEVREKSKELESAIKKVSRHPVYCISATTNEGLKDLMFAAWKLLN